MRQQLLAFELSLTCINKDVYNNTYICIVPLVFFIFRYFWLCRAHFMRHYLDEYIYFAILLAWRSVYIYFTLFLYLRKVGLWFLSFALPFIGTAFPFPHSHSITLFALHFYPPLWMFKFEGVEYCVFRANNPFVEQAQQLCMEHIDVLGSVPECDWNWNSDSVELRTIGFNELWMWI